MKILSTQQIRTADAKTISEENIQSHQLMERAVLKFTNWFVKDFNRQPVIIFCGTGNNGGDGLCIARQLFFRGFKAEIYIIGDMKKASDDFLINMHRLQKLDSVFLPEKKRIENDRGLYGPGKNTLRQLPENGT